MELGATGMPLGGAVTCNRLLVRMHQKPSGQAPIFLNTFCPFYVLTALAAARPG